MTWLTNWNRRKLITVNGSISGALSDYQMKLIVNQASGTDSSGIVNLGGNVLTTFNDLRFTKSDGTTPLNYWIESITGISPNQTATVWIKLAPSPDTIPVSPGTYSFYIYYNNILASASSSGMDTFVVYNGLDTFTEVDPASKYTITPTKITVTGTVTGETSGTHKTIDALTDFIAEFEYLSTGWSYPAVYSPFMFGDAYINPNYGANIGTYNGIGMEMISSAISTLVITTAKWVNGARTEGTSYTIPSGTNFYIRVTRIGTTYTLNVFSNPQRTINYGGSPTSVTVANTSWNILGLAVNDLWVPGGWAGRYQSYYVQNVIIRKYASPEPAFSTTAIGTEELSGAPTCPSILKYSGDIIHLQATPKDGIGPYYVEFRKNNSPISSLSNVIENTIVTYNHLLTDLDISSATLGKIDFSVYIEDSCPTVHQTCTQLCTITIGCLAPVCNFTVT